MGHFQILGLFACFFLFACSDPPVFTPSASTATLRADIQTMQAQWKSERCPSNARKSQCDDLMQRGLQHCLKRNPIQKPVVFTQNSIAPYLAEKPAVFEAPA